MKWRTRLTELLGCKYPIMQGGLSGLGTWELAAAVCEAGAHGNLTAAALERVMLKHHEWRDVPPMWEQAEKLGEQELFGPRLKGPYSFACAYIDRVVTVKEFIDGIIKGAEEILNKLKEEWA